jgi:penicillin-binding protein 1A
MPPKRMWPVVPVDVQTKSEVVQRRMGLIVLLAILAVIIFMMFLLSVNLGIVFSKSASGLPDISVLEHYQPSQSTLIFDRYGTLIANYHGDEDRVVVPLSEISPNIYRAVMATEDNRFYRHNGVDFRGTVRAFAQNAGGGDVQGGSTITQQLIKNLFLTPERSIGRKVAEAILAMRVEQQYPKDKILEMYLNQVYWGNQAYGIEKAARRYFRKSAADLTIAEGALLAGLLKAPEGLSPFAYPEKCRERQLEVLQKMVTYGYITETQREEAARETIQLNKEIRIAKHPFFVTYVIQELVKEFGEDVVRRGGLRVYTTLDQKVQEAAEAALINHVKGLPRYSNVEQGALVAEDLDTGEIIAMVGGVDFEKSQFNNVTQARRAAGSTFKPIVYLTAFRLGIITPDSILVDRPISFSTGYGVWHPKNWDGRYLGPLTARKALALSRNTTTVQLGMKVGIDPIIETAKLAGITSPIDHNFSSLLGSSGVSPFEMLNAFSTFARGGFHYDPTGIHKLEDVRGRVIPLRNRKKELVFDPQDVASLVSILVDVVEQGTGKNALLPDRVVAGKTGTTDRVRDIWFSGFTTDMACVVWMGNTKYVPLNGVFSSNAARVWHDFADAYYRIHPHVAGMFPDVHVDRLKNVKSTAAASETAVTASKPEVDGRKKGTVIVDTTPKAAKPAPLVEAPAEEPSEAPADSTTR